MDTANTDTPVQINISPPTSMTLNQTPVEPALNTSSKSMASSVLPGMGLFVLLIAVVAGLSYFFIIQPKVALVENSMKLKGYLPELRTELAQVNTALDDMYSLITTEESTDTVKKSTLLRLNMDAFIAQLPSSQRKEAGEVAGISVSAGGVTEPLRTFSGSLKDLHTKLNEKKKFGQSANVLGEKITLESNRTSKLRQLKEYAKNGSVSASNATRNLNNLQQSMGPMIDTSLNTELSGVLRDLSSNNLKAQSYVSQATMTTKYYEQISEIQIKMEPMLASYLSLINEVAQTSTPDLYMERIKDIESTITEIEQEIRIIPSSEIPEDMEALHTDNLKVCEILLNNVKDVRKSFETKNYIAFLKTLMQLSQQLEPISKRAVSEELSFWQDNSYLRSGTAIIKEYEKQDNSVKSIIQKNKVPFFTKT
jgi:hypothetical protein